MVGGKRSDYIAAIVLAVLLLGAGVGSGQESQPEPADEFFTAFEGWTDDYNAHVEREGVEFPGSTLLRDERVNLHVEAEDGTEAVYSFRTDERLRISEVEQGARDDVTLRASTTVTALERLASADDPAAALRDAILTREIRLERVFDLPLGLTIAVGALEVAVGSLGLLASLLVLTNGGFGGIASLLNAVTAKLTALVTWPVEVLRTTLGAGKGKTVLLDVFTLFSALDLFGVMNVKERGRAAWGRVTAPVTRASNGSDECPSEPQSLEPRERTVGATTEGSDRAYAADRPRTR